MLVDIQKQAATTEQVDMPEPPEVPKTPERPETPTTPEQPENPEPVAKESAKNAQHPQSRQYINNNRARLLFTAVLIGGNLPNIIQANTTPVKNISSETNPGFTATNG